MSCVCNNNASSWNTFQAKPQRKELQCQRKSLPLAERIKGSGTLSTLLAYWKQQTGKNKVGGLMMISVGYLHAGPFESMKQIHQKVTLYIEGACCRVARRPDCSPCETPACRSRWDWFIRGRRKWPRIDLLALSYGNGHSNFLWCYYTWRRRRLAT